jgi:hypothetical protein
MDQLMPINLAHLGWKRQGTKGEPDLVTIYRTPYPVLSSYVTLCRQTGLEPFAGGTYDKQGSAGPGFITSGYRDSIIEDREHSPHLYAFAIDVQVGNAARQLEVAAQAGALFARVGLYPFRGFIHLDQAPDNWVDKYSKRRYWVQDADRKYVYFATLDLATAHVRQICGIT